MTKKAMNLTEALQEFNRTHTNAAADRLHELFPVSEYIIPIMGNTDLSNPEALKSLPFLIIQHPEVGNYIPVFTNEEQAGKTSLPEGSAFARLTFDQLVSILKRTGNQIPTIIFDPADAALVFEKNRFLTYAASLLGQEQTQKAQERKQPTDVVVSTTNGAKKIPSRTISQLKKIANQDRRIHAVTLAKNVHDNDAESWVLVIEASNDDPKLVEKVASLFRPCFSKHDVLNIELIAPQNEDWASIPAIVRKK